jgi:hypothetical protein
MARFFFWLSGILAVGAIVVYFHGNHQPNKFAPSPALQATRPTAQPAPTGNSSVGYPKNCPDMQWHDNRSRITMDLTGCKNGSHIPLHFGDVLKPAQWEARLYYFGKGEPKTDLEREEGKQLLEVPADAHIEVLNTAHDDGSRVQKIAPHLYEWTGFVKFVYEGNADYLELRRIKGPE